MTNAKKLFRNSLLATTLLTVGVPVTFAATDTTTTETAAAPEQNNGFDLSWLGLLGLIGLAGLRGRNNDRR
jgi:formate hydrogenlyase subunit 3/multisubunit Na+/H+ antiporter MnhD subunit